MRGSEENLANPLHSSSSGLAEGSSDKQSTLTLSIFDHGPDAVFACDAEETITYWNQGASRLFGWTADEACGNNLMWRISQDERAALLDRLRSVVRLSQSLIWLDATKRGQRIEIDASVYPLMPHRGQFTGLICIARRSMHQPVSDFVDNMLEGFQIIDFEFRYVYLNPAAVRQSRREPSELIGKRLVDAYPGVEATELFAVMSRCLRERVDCRFENDFAFLDGTHGVFDLHIVPAPQGLLVFSLDITEERRLAAQVRQARKLSAVGQLAAGAAHDLANLLTVVTGGSEILLERFAEDDPCRGLAVGVRDSADRCSDMVRQILAFRQQTDSQSSLSDLNQVIVNSESVLRQLVGETVAVELRLSPVQGAVNIHHTQLEQILMNLAVNARDSMPQGGTISIRTSEESNEGERGNHPDSMATRFVKLVVSDTGIGMSEEVLARIFEPFFTTKVQGKGAGLGLMTVYNLVQLAGGSIAVESAKGKGSVFAISLPLF
jgi:two-component system cell cycle sensor histidine kinase/response regulator CckA